MHAVPFKDNILRKTVSNIVGHFMSSVCRAQVDKITVNTDMANLSTAVSIRFLNPGPDR